MPRRRRITRYRGKKQGWRIPSVASLAPLAVIAGMNTGAFGYPAIPQFMAGNWNEGLQDAAINTVQMLTGFDYLAKSFDPIKPAVFYGSILIPKMLRKIFGRARAGPINIL